MTCGGFIAADGARARSRCGNSLGVVNMQNITAVAMCTLFSAFAELEKVVRCLVLVLLLLSLG